MSRNQFESYQKGYGAHHEESLSLKSGEQISVLEFDPENEKTPVPAIFVPGWGGTPSVYEANLAAFAAKGRKVISIDAAHGIENEIRNEGEFEDAELRKVSAIIESLDAKGIDKVDAIGHSEGGMDVVLAATLYPSRFRSILLIDPAGIVGEDTPLRLAARFVNDALHSAKDAVQKPGFIKPLLRAAGGIAKSTFESPAWSVREISSIAKTSTLHLLENLREKGIKISIVHGVDDATFPMEKVQGMVKAGMLNGFLSVKGRHGQFILEPEAYTSAADKLLDIMADEKRPIKPNL